MEGLAAARPEEACGEIKFQLRLARKHQIHRLISTRAKTVLGVRLVAAGLSEGLHEVRQAVARAAGVLCGNEMRRVDSRTAATSSNSFSR